MTDILKLAREAAAKHGHTFKDVPSEETLEFIHAFADLIRKDEREACALVCDGLYYKHIGPEGGEVRYGISICASAIRDRGAKEQA